jgi:hypothetical protein
MSSNVTKYHRTVEDFVALVTHAGFLLESLKEAEPRKEFFSDDALLNRRRRIPLFLAISARAKIS